MMAMEQRGVKMNKAFRDGFREGYMRWFWVGIAFSLGIALGSYSHPYEQCKRMYATPEDISECMWIKEN